MFVSLTTIFQLHWLYNIETEGFVIEQPTTEEIIEFFVIILDQNLRNKWSFAFLPWCMCVGERSNIDSSGFTGTSATKFLCLMRHNTVHLHVSELQEQVKSHQTTQQRLKEIFHTSIQEYRDVCYMLLGYKIERLQTSTLFKVSSMFAESQDDYLMFKVCVRNKISFCLGRSLHDIMMVNKGHRRKASHILDFSIRYRCVFSCTFQTLCMRERPSQYSLDKRLRKSQN